MSDTAKYLPESRELFRKFMNDHFKDYFDNMRHAKVGPGSGYWFFYRDSEVIQHLRDIVHHLEETFGYVTIPGNFPTPKKLVETWRLFYDFLIAKDELFVDVISNAETEKKRLPDPFTDSYQIHKNVVSLLEEILGMDEVKRYEESSGQTTSKDTQTNIMFDIAIITALHDTEFEALKKIPGMWIPYLAANDSSNYLEGKIGNQKVLLATDDKMGMAAAASLSTKIIAKFSPKYLIMAGIAGGVKDEEKNYGDVLVARYTWNYESGKRKYSTKDNLSVFEPNPEQIELDASWVKIINELKSDATLLNTIEASFTVSKKDFKPGSLLKVFLGPVASGSAVLADEKKVADLRRGNRKLIGIDMETFGVLYAAKSYASDNSTKAISIKSISDFADQRKNDKYRKYAAYTSAAFIYNLILQKLQNP